MFGPGLPASTVPWSARLRYWFPAAAAAVLALAVVGLVIAAIVHGHRPGGAAPVASDVSAARAPGLLNERMNAARIALVEGSYRMARAELNAARALSARYPGLLEADRAAQLVRWQRQADLLADLLAESVGEIVRQAVGRADKEWDAIFLERYAGKSVVVDARVFRDAGGHIQVDYRLEAAGAVGEWDLEKLRLLEFLPLQQPQRLVFGFRLQSIRRLARDRWAVVPDPVSGILLTDPQVLPGLSVTPDDELIEVLRRQLRWDPGE
jgi:hypothetical protein